MIPSSLTGVLQLRRVLGLTLVLGLLVTSQALGGGLEQIEALGGDGHSYEFEDIDTINLFNGNVVVRIPIASYSVGAHLSYDFTLVHNSRGVWQPGPGGTPHTRMIPNRENTAGGAWRLSLGSLTEEFGGRMTFIDQGGGKHVFGESLHPWANDGDPSTLYTRDGTYLRMKMLNDDRRDVEMPDGRIFEFVSAGEQKWQLSRIRDRFGHSLEIELGFENGSLVWLLTDSLGREHKIYWHSSGASHPYIDRLDLAGPNGRRAIYDLHYQVLTKHACIDNDPDDDPYAQVALLYQVTQPGGLENPWQMGTSANPAYHYCGELEEVRLPSRGRIQWFHANAWHFPRYNIPPLFDPARGIVERRLLDGAGAEQGRWVYRNVTNNTNPELSTGTRTTVVPPGGAGCEVHYFAADKDHADWAYGLPFSRELTSSTGGLTLHLSKEVFASGDQNTRTCTGSKLRKVYLHYEREECGSFGDANHRLYARRVHYDDDPANGVQYVQTRFSDFDGLGHYREVETKGNLHAAGETRIERTQYNRNGNQVLDVDSAGCKTSSYSHPGSNMTWVLGIFSYQRQDEGGVKAQQNYTFEDATGFLTQKRLLRAGTITGNQDVVVDYTRYPNGDPVARRGQLKGEQWSIENQSTPDLWLYHEYQHGVLSEIEYRKPGGAFSGLFQYRATIDRNSGLPTQTTDTAGVKTNYTYDLLGRATKAQPGTGGGACLTYSYTKASGNTGPKWGVVRRNESCSGNLGQRASWFDVWGRKTHDRTYMPSNTWTQKRTRYNVRGWVTGKAAWGSDWTEFLDFDAFGRPRTIRPPGADGAQHEVRYQYAGDRTVRRGVSMDLFGGSSDEMRIRAALEHYDSFGRLARIDTPANPDGTDIATSYQYDVSNRLRHVNFGGQVRTFTYDNRGFLAQECHPEKGVNGNGCVNYSGYDAIGNARWKDEGSRRLTSEYDFAGRLTKVSSDWDATISQWFYDGGDGFGKGKVHLTRRTQRVNFPNDGLGGLDVVVEEKINYTGPAGAPTSHALRVILPGSRPTYGFLMGTLYNDAGQRTLKVYPRCVIAACLSNEPIRHQEFGWTRGFLTEVNGLTSSITYHPQGLWETIVRTNGVTDHQSVWQGQGRPGRIWTTGAIGGNFNTGAYQYDGAGNVKRMGNDDFGYQRSGRLFYAEAGCQNSGEASCHRQRYAYRSSGRGNLYWVETRPRGGSSTVVNWQIDESTNRLSSADYDVAGNMVASPYHGELAYDSQDALVRMGPDGDNIPRQFVYTADGERVWTILEGGLQVLDVRDFDGKLLRTYSRTMSPGQWESQWQPVSDTIWRGSQRLANFANCSGTGVCSSPPLYFPQHATVDHLGTPRLYTDVDGEVIRELSVFPFGREAPGTPSSKVNFTGHERDNLGTVSGVDDMDYMHARFYSPQMARFFSVDPAGGVPSNPQSWNRYTYVLNNPLKYTDPFGLLEITVTAEDPCPTAPEGMSCEDWERQRVEELLQRMQIGQMRSGLFHVGGAAVAAGQRYWAWRTAPQEVTLGVVPLTPGAGISGLRGALGLGQQHHVISKRIAAALADHPTLAGRYAARDPRFVSRAADQAAHRGYQTWHRQLDAEIVDWLAQHPRVTPRQFEQFLRQRYAAPDLLERFPSGF